MAINFPTSLDTFSDPTPTSEMSSPSHSGLHVDINSAVEALEAKVGVNGSAVTTSLEYRVNVLETAGFPDAIIDAKGDLIVGSADDTATRLAVGTNGYALVADSLEATGLKWASVGNVTLTGSETLTNKTLTNPVVNGAILDRSEENWNIVASAATGTINFDVLTSSIWYYTSDATANHTINVRGDGSTTLSSLLAVGDSMTVVWANTNGATAYYPNAFQVDGSSVTPKWQGGTAPAAGNASAVDMYVYTIVKTASSPTYTVFASQTEFA